jgi:hypothetical protein
MRYTLLEHDTLEVQVPRCVEKDVGAGDWQRVQFEHHRH